LLPNFTTLPDPSFTRTRASGASDLSMYIDRVLFIGLFWTVQCIN
jgi:hypothetical protein